MSNGRFNILGAVRNAYLFAGRHAGYLARLALLPFAAQLATMLALYWYRPDAGVLENFLWSLPANVAFAWFMFAETRLLLLGERPDALPADTAAARDRLRLMKASIMILLLFNMAMTAMLACMQWAVRSGSVGESAAASFAVLLLAGAFFWSLRFSVAHILAAVGYPVLPFFRRVRGMEFPLRLLGMGLVCVAPVYLVLEAVLTAVAAPAAGPLTPGQTVAVLTLGAPLVILIPALLNAAAAYALKEMLASGTEAA